MAVILRTAGMERSNAEIKRDYEYLMRLWDDIRELTLRSTAPALVYEEGSLIKRAIRDLYSSDIEEIQVEGESGYDAARSFMNMLMPDHVERVRRYDDPAVPLFQRFQVEDALDDIHSPSVRLRSGGYIVINQTEALVAIDVNSGRATRERHIEETALKTNLEAAEEIARQLRLRDLAGLIVIDFIDMDEHRHQHAVERRFKDAMRSDRARIQIGRISPFGLLELSRQRLRPSLAESSSEICPHCGGTGRVRSTESTVLHVLRGLEEEGMKMRTAEATVHMPPAVALYTLNHKRDALQRIEARYGMRVVVAADPALIPPAFRLDRTRQRDGASVQPARASAPVRPDIPQPEGSNTPRSPAGPLDFGDDEEVPPPRASEGQSGGEYRQDHRDGGEGDGQRRGRRRRRRRGRGGDRPDQQHGGDMHAAPHGDRGPQSEPLARVPDMTAAEMETGAGPSPLVPDQGGAPAGEFQQGQHGQGQGQGEGQYQGQDGEEHRGRRRRRRGRRGGRNRHGGGEAHEGGAPYQGGGFQGEGGAPPQQQRIMGPGHDLPPESPFATAPHQDAQRQDAPRIEGPGDAHDWPWNRRTERFPEPEQAAPAAAPPAPSAAEPPRSFEPAPRPDAISAPAPQPAAPAVEPIAPEPEPSGPPRKGWWKRLTS
jgi:ribonuclease E